MSNSSPLTDDRETGRVEAFSDGVFAVAITLLVLEIKVPTVAEVTARGGLLLALGDRWPVFLAYLTSFLTILVMWVNHHRMFNHIRRVSERFLFLNGFLLLFITLVPFPTGMLEDFMRMPAYRTVAVAAYAATFVAISIFYNLVWHHAIRGDRLLGANPDRVAIKSITAQYRLGPPFYLAAFGLIFVAPVASLVLCLVMAAYFSVSSSGHATSDPNRSPWGSGSH
jgi:uncharacterized membrane protein